ncbi:MAG: hypothetical protein U0821_10975 [Chloroflexota bacterium]
MRFGVWRRLAPVVVAVVASFSLMASQAVHATPVPPDVIGGAATFGGFINGRFLILNMHGGLMHREIEPVRENVRYAAWMNAGAIRFFATDSEQRGSEDGAWVGNRIADLAPTLREHNIRLIVALVNNHQEVIGERWDAVGMKDGFWQLLLPFYAESWRGPYLDFSRRLITAVVERGARDAVLAWEFGNELHTPDQPTQILSFMSAMTAEIRRIDSETMIFPGTMGALHLDPENYNTVMGRRLYCEAPIDAYTLHGYDWLDEERWGDMPIHWDLQNVVTRPCANGRRLPVIVEELGTSRELPGIWGSWDEERRFQQELYQIRMVLKSDQVVGLGPWSSEAPNVPVRRFDDRRGLTSWGPISGGGSCYPGAAGSTPAGYRCRLENVYRALPEIP